MFKRRLITYFVNLSVFSFALMVQASSLSPFEAARKGDLDTLRTYRFNNYDLFLPDSRGFIPYELAALHAKKTRDDNTNDHVELMLWLKEYKPEKHTYGKASISLIQAGLNALGYPAGPIDGVLGSQTKEKILAYQKANDLPQTGRPGPQWLGIFYADIAKDIQFKLTQLGYDTKGTDGLIGNHTRKAITDYRQANTLSEPSYAHLDALLVQSLTDQVNEKTRKEREHQAKQKLKEKKDILSFLQAGLKIKGYRVGKIDGMMGSKTANALKEFLEKNNLPVTNEINQTFLERVKPLFIKTIQQKLTAMGYNTGSADGRIGAETKKGLARFNTQYGVKGSLLSAASVEAINDTYNQFIVDKKAEKQRLAKIKKEKAAKAKAAAKKAAAKKAAAKKAAAKKAAAKKAAAKKKTAQKSTSKKKAVVKKKVKKKVVKKKSVTKVAKKSKRTISVKGNRSTGRMTFSRRGGRVVGCNIAGKKIPIEWCEPFYPLPKNNRCEVTFKSSGRGVINLWCK